MSMFTDSTSLLPCTVQCWRGLEFERGVRISHMLDMLLKHQYFNLLVVFHVMLKVISSKSTKQKEVNKKPMEELTVMHYFSTWKKNITMSNGKLVGKKLHNKKLL